MKTYQDLEKVLAAGNQRELFSFVDAAVTDHMGSPEYKVASAAEEYYRKRNVTMERYRKVLYNTLGQAMPDLFSPNYKLTHGFFRRFVIQQTQYVLSNGITFEKKETEGKLGKDFDNRITELAKKAMVGGVSYGFWNHDHLEVFGFADTAKDPGFVPLPDESSGCLRAGIRYWRVSEGVARRTLYEEDGYTELIKRKGEDMQILREKRPYKQIVKSTEAGGEEEVIGENYPGFPIIPMYANDIRESELVGLRPSIDCYDFIKSGMANNVDEASAFYWTLKNTGGMDDDADLMKFVERMKVLKAMVLEDGVEATAHTLDVPVEANEKLLDRLRRDLYEDAMLVDVERATEGDITATGIRFTYQPQDDKCGDFEYQIRDFIDSLFTLIGIEDNPSFKWNRIANQMEETQMVMLAATELGPELTLKKLPFLTPEEVEARLQEMAAEDAARLAGDDEDEEDDENPDDGGEPEKEPAPDEQEE